ncbi:hypothetical protein MZM54_03605 [[Brevibacterium] frigoritolerans]|nr:hypothetical protein [Peribacillus frigoritolerans]
MEISKGNTKLAEFEEGKWYTKLAELEEGKWYHLKNNDPDNEYTGIKIEDDWIYTWFSGGEFNQEFKMKFPYNQKALNELWQYEFKEDYKQPLDKNVDNLDWVNDIAPIAYDMCNELSYKPQFVKQL